MKVGQKYRQDSTGDTFIIVGFDVASGVDIVLTKVEGNNANRFITWEGNVEFSKSHFEEDIKSSMKILENEN